MRFLVLCLSLGYVMAAPAKVTLGKRDYAAALTYLRTAIASYQQDGSTPPAELVQLEQQLSSSPPPFSSPQVYSSPQFSSPQLYSPQQPVWDDPTMMVLGAQQDYYFNPSQQQATDIEEDDEYDPEEDPDDVDDPPFVNGRPVDREE